MMNGSSITAAQNALTLYVADICGHEGRHIHSVQIFPQQAIMKRRRPINFPPRLIMSAHSMCKVFDSGTKLTAGRSWGMSIPDSP